MVRLFSKLIRLTDVVLDIGANIGCTSLLFGQLASRVLSFEPSPSTWQVDAPRPSYIRSAIVVASSGALYLTWGDSIIRVNL